MAKFFRGPSTSFNAETHKDGLYFATDINELYLSFTNPEGELTTRIYGSKEIVVDIDGKKDGDNYVAENTIVVSFKNGESREINLQDILSLAVAPSAEGEGGSQGLMSAEDKFYLDTLWASKDEFGKVDGVAADDKVLSLGEDKLISATLDLDYYEDAETGDKKIRLLGKDNVVLGEVDAAPFIKDGMLDNVEVVTKEIEVTTGEGDEAVTETISKKYIEFTWNVEGEDGELKSDLIAIEDLVISYAAGNGINISDAYEISIKLAADTESKRNFLEVDADGLRMSKIDTSATILQEDITVAGISGTLGTGSYKNGSVISAGTSIYEILKNILCKREFPSAKVSNNGGLTSAYAAPSFTLTNSGKTVEVGTSATVSEVVGYDPSNTPTSRQYSGFSYGYGYDGVDAEGKDTIIKVSGTNKNPSSVPVSGITLKEGTFTLTRTYNGFGLEGAALTSSSTSTEASTSCKIVADSSLIVKEGDNTVTFSMSGPGHYGKIVASPKYYIISNLGDTSADKVVAAQAETEFNPTATTGTKSLTVTGAYKYYIGYAASVPVDVQVEGSEESEATAAIKGLTHTSGWCSNVVELTDGGTLPAGKTMCIAVPSSYKLESIVNGFDLESIESFKVSTVHYRLVDNSLVEYKIYSMSSAADWKYKTIKISKA